MSDKLKIGYLAHWFQPRYRFVDFLQEQGIEAKKIDYSYPGYLEEFEVVLIEQNGFNDYIENDELYIRDWIRRGGILLFMHQDYCRWAPYFLPEEVGYTQLIHRHVPTINGGKYSDGSPYMCYMMPWIEAPGKRLFSEPEKITPDEMLDWKITADSFSVVQKPTEDSGRIVRTAAESCFLANPNWEILGSYMDPAVRDGALILRAKCGKGMIFLNQILFPEDKTPEAERSFAFWKKYIRNLLAYFERFRRGEPEILPETAKPTLPVKKNYKLAIHMHSLDWYGCDSAPGTINAIMRYMGYDICTIAVKDIAPYNGKLDTEKYSDDKVLFLDGQEYHPFNWHDRYEKRSHNNYHMLAMGIDPDAYTQEFTRSVFSDEEVDRYLRKAIDFIHEHHGAVCTAHPWNDYWYDYPYDAADQEPLTALSGTVIEKYWLSGRRIPVMNSVDLFGMRRIFDNPAVNFIYLNGETPCRDSVVKAVRSGHTIAACGFDEADITLNGHIPGDEVTLAEARTGTVEIRAKIADGPIRKIRVFSADKLIWSKEDNDTAEVSLTVPMSGLELKQFVRVELEGENPLRICNSTPFYLK